MRGVLLELGSAVTEIRAMTSIHKRCHKQTSRGSDRQERLDADFFPFACGRGARRDCLVGPETAAAWPKKEAASKQPRQFRLMELQNIPLQRLLLVKAAPKVRIPMAEARRGAEGRQKKTRGGIPVLSERAFPAGAVSVTIEQFCGVMVYRSCAGGG